GATPVGCVGSRRDRLRIRQHLAGFGRSDGGRGTLRQGRRAARRARGAARRSAALVDGVARPDLVHLRVTVFVGDGVVHTQHGQFGFYIVDRDFVVGATDGHLLARSGDGQGVVG